MSHKAVLATFCTDAEAEVLRSEIDDLTNLLRASEIAKAYSKEINDVLDQLKNELTELQNLNQEEVVDEDFINRWMRERAHKVDTILKKVSNLRNSINLASMTKSELQKVSEEILKLIRENGTMVSDAMYSLSSKGLDVTPTSIEKEIESIRNVAIDNTELEKYRAYYKSEIEKTTMPNEFKSAIANELLTIRSSQEVADFSAYLETKKSEYHKTIRMAKQFIDAAGKTLNFKLVERSYKIIKDEEHIDDLRVIVKLRNNKNNVIGYSFSLKGSVEYQMGNYEGHMCEADAEKLTDELRDRGYSLNTISITRNVSNAKPIERAAKLNEKGK